jgi:hypothetical protein
MPDLQTELKKLETLAFDDSGEPTQKETTMPHLIKNNASRKTFNFVRDNPNTTRKNAINALTAEEISESTSSSLIGQFVRQGMIKSENGGLTVTQPEYTPLKALYEKKSVAKETVKKKEALIMQAPTMPEITQDTLVTYMLCRMSIVQARDMYEELKRIFGG